MQHDLPKIFRALYRIRRVEEEIARIYPSDKIKSPVHLSIGQESVSVGVCEALRPQDMVFGTYRSHAIYLAKGGDLNAMMAELYGKVGGCARGKGGSMHLIAPQVNFLGASAVVGTTIPHAVGAAYAFQQQESDRIVVAIFGDGATEEGAYHESLNFAALKHLPLIFVCENNGYAIHTHVLRRQLSHNLCERAATYGLVTDRIDDGDVLRIHDRMNDFANQIRKDDAGPFFLECLTYRWKEHVGPNDDWSLGYRHPAEAESWKQNDQIDVIGNQLETNVRQEIEEEVESEIADAITFAEESPFPDRLDLWTHVFKEP